MAFAPASDAQAPASTNAAAESFFATLKTELIHRASWPTRQHAKTAIFHYVEGFYNRLRRHSTLNYRSRPTLKPTTAPLPWQPKQSVHPSGSRPPQKLP